MSSLRLLGMKRTILCLLFSLTLLTSGCSSLAKYERPGHGPYSATRAGWEAIEYSLYLRDPSALCSVARSFVFPGLLPLWIVNLGIAIPFDTLTLPWDLLGPGSSAEASECPATAPADAGPQGPPLALKRPS